VVSVVAMVFLALGAGVALADDARIQCKSVPCYASGNSDLVQERKGNDRIYVDDGDKRDTASGGQGNSDTCYVDARSEAGQGCGRVIVR
jgi:hypothetical protein